MEQELVTVTGRCIDCKKCQHIGLSAFCGGHRLTKRALYSKTNSCQEFKPKPKKSGVSGWMLASDLRNILNKLDAVDWQETAFANLQWYDADAGVYILRINHGEPNEHLCIIRAKSKDDAIFKCSV